MEPYEYECLDGDVVTIGALERGDVARYRKFVERQSTESVYRRFFSAHRPTSDGEIDTLLDPGRPQHLVVSARVDDELVAVGELSCDRVADRAEVAFLVDDDWHHQGLATELLRVFARQAREWGFDHLDADSLGYNVDMMRVFDDSGFPVDKALDQGVWTYRIALV